MISGAVWADRLIEMPIAPKVRKGMLRFETLLERGTTSDSRSYLQYGLDPNIEVAFRLERVGNRNYGSGDISYQLLPPTTDLAPGFAVGVMDFTNQGQDGRRYFATVTQRFSVEGDDLAFTPGELTFGFRLQRSVAPMAGIMLPFSQAFRLMVEHDSYRLNAGIELRPSRALAFRFVERGQTPEFGFRYSAKF